MDTTVTVDRNGATTPPEGRDNGAGSIRPGGREVVRLEAAGTHGRGATGIARRGSTGIAEARPYTVLTLRLVGAALVGTMGGIHAYLWTQGYRDIPSIGPLFLVSAVISLVAAAGILVVPTRYLGLAAAGGALLALGTLGGLVISITVGLFGFQDTFSAPLATETVWVEGAAVVVLAALAALRPGSGPLLPFRLRRPRTASSST